MTDKKIETVFGSVYDYPSYYDVLFNSHWKNEYEFLLRSFRDYADGNVRRVFEPACGTGRLLWRLARDGYEVSGLDLNSNAVDFCNRRMRRHGFAAAAKLGNIAVDLRLDEPIDAAFNPVSSFCHLISERDAVKHLELVAESLRPGGIYILGFHLKPSGDPKCDRESWVCARGKLAIKTELKTVHWDEKKRLETIEFRINAETPQLIVKLFDTFPFRTYTIGQFSSLLKKTPTLKIVAIYDFSYEPITIDSYTEDAVFILRKT